MNMRCPRCGGPTVVAGQEDARAFYECPECLRVWSAGPGRPAHANGAGERGAPRVLVVDDSPELLRLLAAWLEDEGCAVQTAMSGREALEAAAVHPPEVVFLDLVIPRPGGFQVCEALSRRRGPEVVMMTGFPDAGQAREAADLGVVALLQKPLTRERVLAALSTALERCRRDRIASGGPAD